MDEEQKRLAEEILGTTPHLPSFAKKLFFGEFLSDPIYPFPRAEDLDEAQELVQKLNQFMDQKLDPDQIDRKAEIPQDVIDGLGELGILGMTIPKEYGGLGMSQYAYCRAAEEIAKRCAATALFVNAHQSIGLKALLLFGTEDQKKQWLPQLAQGKALAAFSLTEPNAGSDANGVETKAFFDAERKTYRIQGRKQWTTNGAIAKVLTVMAKTEVETSRGKEDKVTAFIVTPDMPGFKVLNPALEKVGMRGSRTANLEFDNVQVPAENMLGPKGGGLKVCLTVLDYGRTTFGATCVGAAKTAYSMALEHAKSRYQFKRPLASFGLVKEKLARMAALLYAMESSTYLTAGLIDAGVEDIMIESAMLKVFASDSLWTILYETMQIFGGKSFFTSTPLERMMRDARLNMIGEGSNEVMRAFIAVAGMRDVGLELKGYLDVLKNPFGHMDELKDFTGRVFSFFKHPQMPFKNASIQNEAKELSDVIVRFNRAILKLLATHKEEIIEKQLQLNRISTIAMAIYNMTAVLSRLDQNPKAEDLSIGKLYCKIALDEIKKSLEGIDSNHDEEIEKVADGLTGANHEN